MGRRKRQFLDDDDDSDSSANSDGDQPFFGNDDPDARAERELFENPYKQKRRRQNGKEDAIYGVFGSDDDNVEDEQTEGRKARRRTKAPAFVASGSKATLDQDVTMEDDEAESEDNEAEAGVEAEEVSSSDSEPSKAPSPLIQEEEDEEQARSRYGGIGLGGLGGGRGGIGSSKPGIGSATNDTMVDDKNDVRPRVGLGGGRGGIGSSKGGIGSLTPAFSKGGIGSLTPAFSKGGIGSSRLEVPESSASPSPGPAAIEDFPAAFGSARPQRSFLRDAVSSTNTPPRSATPISTAERVHFNQISETIGARLLSKMGWQAGQGLGTTGEGIVTPVESKLRPKGMGLAFKGFKEKTEQAKAEARRRGEIVSDDEEESKTAARKARKAAKVHEARTDVWKKPKKTKTRVEHKTYEEIIADAGEATPQAGVGPIIDATGRTVRALSQCSVFYLRPSPVAPRSDFIGGCVYGIMDTVNRSDPTAGS